MAAPFASFELFELGWKVQISAFAGTTGCSADLRCIFESKKLMGINMLELRDVVGFYFDVEWMTRCVAGVPAKMSARGIVYPTILRQRILIRGKILQSNAATKMCTHREFGHPTHYILDTQYILHTVVLAKPVVLRLLLSFDSDLI